MRTVLLGDFIYEKDQLRFKWSIIFNFESQRSAYILTYMFNDLSHLHAYYNYVHFSNILIYVGQLEFSDLSNLNSKLRIKQFKLKRIKDFLKYKYFLIQEYTYKLLKCFIIPQRKQNLRQET